MVNNKTKETDMKAATPSPEKYEQALKKLETIVRQMEDDQLDVDQMTEQLKEALHLIQFCRDRLTKTDEEIQRILSASEK